MYDKLKDFVENNREDFDSFVPGDLWAKIDAGIHHKPSFINSKNITDMFKYGFGASALVIGTLIVIKSLRNGEMPAVMKIPVIVDSPAPVVKTPKTVPAILPADLKKEDKPVLPAAPLPEKEMTPPEKPAVATMPEAPGSNEASASREETSSPSPMAESETPCPSTKDEYPKTDGPGYSLIDTIFKSVKRIEVKGAFCNVNVRAHAKDQVSFHGRIGEGSGELIMLGTKAYKKRDYKIKFEKKDEVLTVWIEQEDLKHRSEISGSVNDLSVLDFEVPVKTDVNLSNNSGNITMNGLENKSMVLKTQFGNIKAENIVSDLTLKSSSGNITVSNIKGELKTESSFGNQWITDIAGNTKVRSSSGNVSIKQLRGNVDVNSSFGYQKYENITGNIVSIASSGNISVKHLKGHASTRSSFGKQEYEDVEGDIHASASSGDIRINGTKGTLTLGTSFGDITGKDVMLLSSAEFKTSSGDIRMNILNEMKDLSFDLQSSSGDLVVEKDNTKNSSDKKLMVGKGAILIRGVSSFGDQSYR
jgi:hypothetical protein